MKNSKFTYQKSGVNISEADKFVNFILKIQEKKQKIKILEDSVPFQIFPNISKTQR